MDKIQKRVSKIDSNMVRDFIAMSVIDGMSSNDIAQQLGVSSYAVNNALQAYERIKTQNWEGLYILANRGQLRPIERTAEVMRVTIPDEVMQKCRELYSGWCATVAAHDKRKKGTEMSEPEQYAMALEQPEETERPLVDGDGVARLMCALGKIDERLETIADLLQTMSKESNCNADNLYNFMSDFRGALSQDIRKLRKYQ